MKLWLIMVCGIILVAFVASVHFGAQAFFQARQLEAQVEDLTVRERIMKQQVGELAQKVRVVERVNSFVTHAEKLGLSPEQWEQYDVSIQDAVTFKELALMIDQCVHNKELYYKPLTFHIAVGQQKIPDKPEAVAPDPTPAPGTDKKPADLALSMKGAFLVRH